MTATARTHMDSSEIRHMGEFDIRIRYVVTIVLWKQGRGFSFHGFASARCMFGAIHRKPQYSLILRTTEAEHAFHCTERASFFASRQTPEALTLDTGHPGRLPFAALIYRPRLQSLSSCQPAQRALLPATRSTTASTPLEASLARRTRATCRRRVWRSGMHL